MLLPQCVNLSVASLDAMEIWYRDKLGFVRTSRSRYEQMGLEIAFLRQGDFEIELIQFDGSQAPSMRFPDPPRHAGLQGMTHFGLRVENTDQAIADLESKGVPVLFGPKVFEELKMKLFFVRDIEGNLIKFVQRLL